MRSLDSELAATETTLADNLSRWLRNLLFEVTPGDPAVLAGTGVVLVSAALIASWLPGRKAARIPEMEAIQSE